MIRMLTPIRFFLLTALLVSLISCAPMAPQRDRLQPGESARSIQPLDSSSLVVVLLPSQGEFTRAAAAIRTGIEIAHAQSPAAQRPSLLFLDTSAGIRTELLNQARRANLIIGPLVKEDVDQIMQQSRSLPPIIALNHVSEQSPAGFYQFGFSPEEDGRQIAEKAFFDGHQHAAILFPDNSWGTRHLQGFIVRWQELGKSTVNVMPYPEEGALADTIKALLDNKGDFVYIVARPQKARELRTNLMYYGEVEHPAYLSGRAYEYRLHHFNTSDLTNAWIPVMPITLPQNTSTDTMPSTIELMIRSVDYSEPQPLTWSLFESQPGFQADLAQFYGMGADALLLAQNAHQLQPGRAITGASGDLFNDGRGVIRRQPLWIHYLADRVVTAGPYAPMSR